MKPYKNNFRKQYRGAFGAPKIEDMSKMQNLLADTQYAFCTTNMWFNFQAHHLHENAAMETQDRATRPTSRINILIIGKQTIMKLSTIVSIALATIVIVKKALSLSTTFYCWVC